MSRNGRPWRLQLKLPHGYEQHTQELFEWLRTWVIPACLNAPIRVTLSLHPPESDDPEE